MENELSQRLEIQLQRRVQLIPRGHPASGSHLAALPVDWQAALDPGLPVSEAVETLWQPLAERARGFTVRLGIITLELALVVFPESAASPALLYLTEREGELHGWLGGPPAGEHEIETKEAELGGRLPESFRRFSAIHNGFLEDGDPALGIRPLAGLRLTNPQPACSPPWLEFAALRDGSRQCFVLEAPAGRGDYLTVRWEPENQKISPPQSFWSFLKGFTISDFG